MYLETVRKRASKHARLAVIHGALQGYHLGMYGVYRRFAADDFFREPEEVRAEMEDEIEAMLSGGDASIEFTPEFDEDEE